MALTWRCLDLRHTQQKGNRDWYWKPSQLSRVSEVMHLRKESTTTLCCLNIVLYYIINLNLSPTDNRSYHPSLKKPFFVVNGDHHKNPQLDTVQGSTDWREPSSKVHLYCTALPCPALHCSCSYCSGNTKEEGMRRLWELEYQEVRWETTSLRNAYINKARTMAESINGTSLEENIFEGSHP